MNIDKHINLLLNKYNLTDLYNKFINSCIILLLFKESFNWLLLYFKDLVENTPKLINTFIIILISILIIIIPLEKKFNDYRIELIKEIKIANIKFFTDRLTKLDKNILLNFNLVKFYNIIEHFNDNLEQYFNNIKIKYELPFKFITIIFIAINKNFNLLIGLFAIYYSLVKVLNENKMLDEIELTKEYFKYDNIIRNYIINSKNLLINNELNNNYLINNIYNLENVNKNILKLNNKLDFKINILLVFYIIFILVYKIKSITTFDFYYYFTLIYDIEYFSDKIIEFHKNKNIINKMQKRLDYLYSYKFNNDNNSNVNNNNQINQIIINEFKNENPKLINEKKLIINKGDHILLEGKSGSGKTSLLYLLKGIIKINLDIFPDINTINNNSYLTLSNNKSLYSGNLYDIITNYSENPNIELINFALNNAKIFDKLNYNKYINIETLSSGERVRLLISRIIYTIKNKNYSILLFDEIDENLNDDLAIEIYNSINNIFNDNIILYITHNEQVKKIFKKKIKVINGEIFYNIN